MCIRDSQDLLSDKIGYSELQQAMSDLAQNLEYLYPMRDLRNQYPFRGDEQLDLEGAMSLMDQMQSIDELERQIERTQYGGDIEDIDADKLEDLLGKEARETLDQMKSFLEILEEAGYIRKKGNGYELTPRGTRKIGQRALVEIYQSLKKDSFGKHEIRESGHGGDRTETTKKYEFGDPFHLHIQKTMFNSMLRNGPGTPIVPNPPSTSAPPTPPKNSTSSTKTTSTKAGNTRISLTVPRKCVKPGKSFKVTLGFKRIKKKGKVVIKVTRSDFYIAGERVKIDKEAPYVQRLTVRVGTTSGATVEVRARAFLKVKKGKQPTKSVTNTVRTC